MWKEKKKRLSELSRSSNSQEKILFEQLQNDIEDLMRVTKEQQKWTEPELGILIGGILLFLTAIFMEIITPQFTGCVAIPAAMGLFAELECLEKLFHKQRQTAVLLEKEKDIENLAISLGLLPERKYSSSKAGKKLQSYLQRIKVNHLIRNVKSTKQRIARLSAQEDQRNKAKEEKEKWYEESEETRKIYVQQILHKNTKNSTDTQNNT